MKTRLNPRFIPHFNLQPKKGNHAYLIMQIGCSDKRVKYSLGLPAIDLNPKKALWNKIKKKLGANAPIKWSDRVREVDGWISEFVKGKETVLADDLINHLRILDKKEPLITVPVEDRKGAFFKEIKKLIAEAEKGVLVNPKNKLKYSEGTLICWAKTMNNLEKYLPNLTFDVTMEDYDTFVIKLQEAGKSNSYIGALIKDWKTFMKHTAKKGLHNNQVYKSEDFKQITEVPSTQVALTLDEIQALRDVELTGIQDEIRDMFVFNCSNGLRISDMESFNDTAIINEELGIATVVTKKTDEEIVIDLKEDYFRLKTKYGGERLPELYHRNVINREIKDIAKKAKINSLVKVISVKGGKIVVENKEKWELIKNHTARRTFITHELKYNDALTVSALAGITPQTMKKSYDLRTKFDITMASKERRLKREAAVA